MKPERITLENMEEIQNAQFLFLNFETHINEENQPAPNLAVRNKLAVGFFCSS